MLVNAYMLYDCDIVGNTYMLLDCDIVGECIYV